MPALAQAIVGEDCLSAPPICDLPSRASRPGLRAADRLDAYWQLPGTRWSPRWTWRAAAERVAASGQSLPAGLDLSVSREDAIASLWARRRSAPWPVRLRALAAIYHWRVLTTQQIASVLGATSIVSDLLALWQAGLVRCADLLPRELGPDRPRTRLWRIDWDWPFKELLAQLTPWERYGLLTGAEWRPRSVNWAHDVLVADTTLRVAELAPAISAVYGEELASASKLTSLPPNVTRQARGDAVWVREDGLRIVVELSISAYHQSLAKAERWARVLEADKSGDLFVLFLIAPSPGQRRDFAQWSLGSYQRAVEEAAWSSLSAVQAGVPERMGVASLPDWAPATGKVSRDFPRLPIMRPTGPPGARFEEANLADSFDVVFDPGPAGADAVAPMAWASLSYAMPWWLAAEAEPVARQYLPDVWKLGLPRQGRVGSCHVPA